MHVDDGSEADLREIKQQLESTIGADELQQKLTRVRSRISESLSESGSVTDRKSLNGSLTRYNVINMIFCYVDLCHSYDNLNINLIYIVQSGNTRRKVNSQRIMCVAIVQRRKKYQNLTMSERN